MATVRPFVTFRPPWQSSLRPLRPHKAHQHHHKSWSPQTHNLSSVAWHQRLSLNHGFPPINPHRAPLRPHRRTITTRAAAANLFRRYPFSMTVASAFLLITSSMLIYVNYYYRNHILLPYYPYPEAVAQSLRKAVYYTNVEPNPKSAMKYYRQALERAAACGMDPFADAVIGIRIQVANMLEQAGKRESAARVLEMVRNECLMAAEEAEQGEGLLEGMVLKDTRKAAEVSKGAVAGGKGDDEEEQETPAGRRRRLLQCAVKAGVKLGDLYSHGDIHDPAMAEERLVWAVTTLLKERQRRETEGVKEGEGEWFASGEEIGGALESLATHYFYNNLSYLAVPLYLQALTFLPPKSCHAVSLMNNLAVSLSLQNPPSTPGSPPASPITYLTDAQTWAHKALALANTIEPPERNEECDSGCCAAMISLGDFYQMAGSREDAKRWWREGVPVCRAVGGETGMEGVKNGERGLAQLEKGAIQ